MRIAAAVAALLLCSSAALAEETPAEPAKTVEIFIDGDITQYTASDVQSRIEEAKKAGQKELRVRIDSFGGSVFDGLRIIRVLSDSGLSTVCDVESSAMSMAAVILESPACGKRLVRPWSVVMFHEAAIGVNDAMRLNDAAALAVCLRAINRSIAAMVTPRLGISIDEYLSRIDGGRQIWVVGMDAADQKMADEVRRPPVRQPEWDAPTP